jgi:predicted CoA-substrate-specific enzyme activase
MAWFMGIDIGSATSRGVVTKNGELAAYYLLPSGINYRATSQRLRDELLAKLNLSTEDIAYTVATGNGRNSVPFANQRIGDILCCAKGLNNIFPEVRTIIDIGNQSSQVIRISERGQVINFAVSEICAAGSGYFLQIIANVLHIDLEDIGSLSLRSKNPVAFTTGCAVFGESEAISRVAEGIPKEDILAGAHNSLADKLSALIERVGLEPQCAISSGGALDVGLIKSIEEKLGVQLLVPPHPQISTALGAAIIAEGIYNRSSNKTLVR